MSEILEKNKFELLPRHSCSPPQLRSAKQGSSSLFAHRQGLSETPPPKIACPLLYVVFILSAALYIFWHYFPTPPLGVHHLASSLLLDLSLLYATIQGQNPARACSTLASPCALGTRPAAPLSKEFIIFFIRICHLKRRLYLHLPAEGNDAVLPRCS